MPTIIFNGPSNNGESCDGLAHLDPMGPPANMGLSWRPNQLVEMVVRYTVAKEPLPSPESSVIHQ